MKVEFVTLYPSFNKGNITSYLPNCKFRIRGGLLPLSLPSAIILSYSSTFAADGLNTRDLGVSDSVGSSTRQCAAVGASDNCASSTVSSPSASASSMNAFSSLEDSSVGIGTTCHFRSAYFQAGEITHHERTWMCMCCNINVSSVVPPNISKHTMACPRSANAFRMASLNFFASANVCSAVVLSGPSNVCIWLVLG